MQCNPWACAFGVLVTLAYGGWLGFQQSEWWHGLQADGSMSLSFASGLMEYGWPTTHLTQSSSIGSSEVTWRVKWWPLTVNVTFCVLLAASVGFIAWQVLSSLLIHGGRPSFSLAALLLAVTSVALVWPLWNAVYYIPFLTHLRWSFPMTRYELPPIMSKTITVGLVCFAFTCGTALWAIGRTLTSSERAASDEASE